MRMMGINDCVSLQEHVDISEVAVASAFQLRGV
jgi:hypothetical protein